MSVAPESPPVRRRPPAPTRAALPVVAAAAPGEDRSLSGSSLIVHDDNFAWLPDGSVDLVLTDPPFNIARDTNFHTYEGNTINSYRFDQDKGWDSHEQGDFIGLLNDWAQAFARVLRPGGTFAVFCADAYVSHLIDALHSAGLKPRRTLTWRKPNAVPINRKSMMMSACEYVVVGVKGSKATFNADLPMAAPGETIEIERLLVADKAAAVVDKAVRAAVSAVTDTGAARPAAIEAAVSKAVYGAALEAARRVAAMYVDGEGGHKILRGCVPNYVSLNSKAGNRLHPTEKPVELLSYLVKLLSQPGDVILDPFAGSGSTGEAAARAGRSCILVERDREFYRKAADRLADVP